MTRYYRRRWVGRKENVWVVVGVTFALLSALDFWNRVRQYHRFRDRLREEESVKVKVAQLRRERRERGERGEKEEEVKRRKNKMVSRKTPVENITDEELDLTCEVTGAFATKPTWRSALFVRILWLPSWLYTTLSWCCHWVVHYWIQRRPYEPQDYPFLARTALHLSEWQWNELEATLRDDVIRRQVWVPENKRQFFLDQKRQLHARRKNKYKAN